MERPGFEVVEHDIVDHCISTTSVRSTTGVPNGTGSLPVQPRAYDEDLGRWHRQHARYGQGQGIRLLHTSTSEVYGDPEISPQRGLQRERESDRSQSYYDEAKGG